jgi:hypothetical protein
VMSSIELFGKHIIPELRKEATPTERRRRQRPSSAGRRTSRGDVPPGAAAG